MPLNPAYETKTMLAPFEQGPLVSTFLRDTFFGGRQFAQTPLIEFDFRRGRRKMAPFVAPLVGGKLMERQGFETRFFRAPRIAPVRALRTPDLEARMMGETVYSQRSPADRAAELLAEDAIFCDEAISRREEWMCRNVLVNGAITVTADTGYQMVVDFTQSSAGAANNHIVPAVKWDVASGSDPIADLETARLATIKDSGIAPNVALFGVNAAKVFIRNPQVATLLDKQRFEIAGIQPIIQSNSVVRFGRVPGLELYEYAEYFEDDVGTIFPMLPDNFVMLLSTNAPNKIVYGAFTQLEDAKAKRFVTYQQARIPFVYGDEEGGSLFYRLTSCPLPMPADILGFRIIEALAMTFPGRSGGDGEPEAKYVEGEAVLNVLTGEIEGGAEEAAELKAKAVEDAEKRKETTSTANWKTKTSANDEETDQKLEEHTVDELRDIAAEEGADLSGASVKADIIKAIKKNRKNKK
jgi:Phage major capsid protein E